MLALPLKLEGSQIIDANGKMIALVRGNMADAEIIATINSRADLLAAAKAVLLANDCDYQAWADLKAAIAKAEEA